MSDQSQDYLDKAKLCIAEEIIRGILRRQPPKYRLTATKIRGLLSDIIGQDIFEELEQTITKSKKDWKEFLDSMNGLIHVNKSRYYVKRQPQRGIQKRMLLNNLSIEDYRQSVLSEVISNLLHNDINHRGHNNNTTFHLIASLPIECVEAGAFQISLIELLLKANPDCSLKNDQDMTALHIVAGNHLLDPQKGFIVSNQRGLSSEINTSGRHQKLKCLYFEGAFRCRGPKGNSILHEWTLYCASCGVLSDSEMEIGNWISTVHNFQANLVNDDGCTPLHYAFANDLVDFLCSSGCASDHKNVTRDAPLTFIIKQTLLYSLPNDVALEDGKDVKEAFAQTAGIHIDKLAASMIKLNIVDLNIETFQKNNFALIEKDGRNLSCLSYLLLFVRFLATHMRSIPGSLQLINKVIEKWVMVLATSNGDAQAMSKTLSTLIVLFFALEIGEIQEANQILSCIENLLKADADPNKVTCSNGDSVLHYCCKNVSHSRHLKLVEMLCEYGANRSSRNQDSKLPNQVSTNDLYYQQIAKVLRETKLKRRIDIDIQSVRYRSKLESLCCQPNPKRIDDMRYDKDIIGKGAMSSIFLSINEKIGKEMALKRMDKHYFQKEVKAEIEALKRLEQNQNVVNFYDLLDTEEFYYLAIELMDGDLTLLVEQKEQFLRNPASTQKLAADIVCGLAFLHNNNMIHRDIKPGNILYREKPECCLKIADFGLTKIMDTSTYDQTSVLNTASASLCGTRGWMAPELVNRVQSSHTKESDMYALGLVLHYLFSKGFHPFHSSSTKLGTSLSQGSLKVHELETKIVKGLGEMSDNVSPEQHHLVICLLSQDPKKRPMSQQLLQQHCYFWSSLKKVKFMWTIGDQPEVAKPSSCPNSTFATDLQKTTFGHSVRVNTWSQKIYPLFQEVSARGSRSIDTKAVVGLIRFFRNAYAHFEERSKDRKVELLEDHIVKEFPEFFMTVWIEVYNQGWAKPGQGKDWLLRMIKEMN